MFATISRQNGYADFVESDRAEIAAILKMYAILFTFRHLKIKMKYTAERNWIDFYFIYHFGIKSTLAQQCNSTFKESSTISKDYACMSVCSG